MTTTLVTTMSAGPANPASPPPHRVWHYPAHPRFVGAARRDVGAQLRLWELDELRDAAVLVVSELATNAVLTSYRARMHDGEGDQACRLALRLTYSHQDVIVELWDGAVSRPIRRADDLAADDGHGLHLVATLTRDWGYYRVGAGDVTNGKVVWAALRHGKPPIRAVTDVPPASLDHPRSNPSNPRSEDAPGPDVPDRALLQRVIDGLRGLDDGTRQVATRRHEAPPEVVRVPGSQTARET